MIQTENTQADEKNAHKHTTKYIIIVYIILFRHLKSSEKIQDFLKGGGRGG